MATAYCYASGLIEFGEKMPDGALPIATGDEKKLRAFIGPLARHGYSTRMVEGRPQKIPGTDTLLVPGIPEAPDQMAALDALYRFTTWIGEHAPRGISMFHSAHAPSRRRRKAA